MAFGKVFPKGNLQERIRFSLIKKAYVDARYKADYKISTEELAWLAERVTLLRNLTQQICTEKIESFSR